MSVAGNSCSLTTLPEGEAVEEFVDDHTDEDEATDDGEFDGIFDIEKEDGIVDYLHKSGAKNDA